MISRILRISAIAAAGVLIILALAALLIAQRLYASLPQTEGEILVDGLYAEARIIRDEWGVPHIFGETDHDVFFALGAAHAQDRFFQMDFTRRFVRGRLSEVMGEATLSTDAQMRIMGLGAAADAAYDTLPVDAREAMEAYAAGVNSIIQAPGYVAPPEYLILRFSPEAWRPQDTAVIYKAIALDLTYGALAEPARDALREHLGEDRFRQFVGRYHADIPTTLNAADLGLEPGADATPEGATDPVLGTDGPARNGSNNWVIAPERSATGAPILANDPHLGLSAPSIWYLARLSTPEGSVVGVTLAGTPFVTLGRNENMAWGFTNTGPDVGDLHIVSPEEVVSTREETIRVRGGDAVSFTRRETVEGPVLEPEYYPDHAREDGRFYVLQTTLDEPDDTTPAVGLHIMRAEGWEDFVSAIEGFLIPQQSIVVADRQGGIGFYAPARIPVRDETGAWTGAIPFDELPHARNPERGFFATANNKIVPDEYPHFITADWYGVFRISAIWDGIESVDQHDMETMQTLQLDVTSSLATQILPVLEQAAPQTEAGRDALAVFTGWDGALDGDSAEALIYAIWLRHLNRALYADELGEEHMARWGGDRRMFVADALTRDAGAWCDDVATETEESCIDTVSAALDAAMAEAVPLWGRDIAAWRYDAVHMARHDHPVFTRVGMLRNWFDILTPFPGDGSTVNVAHSTLQEDRLEVFHAASYRALYDLADMDRSRYIITTGQSGHFLSRHYADQAELWGRGEYIEIPSGWTPESAPEGARELVLRPAE